jgi:hypothetical protein
MRSLQAPETREAMAASAVVLGFALVAAFLVVLALPLLVSGTVLHERVVDRAVFVIAWGFILLTPVAGILALVLGRDRRGLRHSAILQLAVWGATVVWSALYPFFE